jgi:hypothetical protein
VGEKQTVFTVQNSFAPLETIDEEPEAVSSQGFHGCARWGMDSSQYRTWMAGFSFMVAT